MDYKVTFIQYYTYNVYANDEEDAFNEAYKEFQREMYYPSANTWYDDVEIECKEEDDED